MKRMILWLVAIVSGIYVLGAPIPDPLPFIDEAVALLIFTKVMNALGYDLTAYLPFLSKGKRKAHGAQASSADGQSSSKAADATVDV